MLTKIETMKPSSPTDLSLQPAESAYSAVDLGATFQTSRGRLEVLRDVSFELAPGTIVGIVGRSGTGKSTLLRVLGGLMHPTVGAIKLHGNQVSGPPTEVMTVFQDYTNALLPWRSVARNVGLGLERRLSKADQDERVSEALRMVDLTAFADEYPWRLSGGMQQRVQIARALAMKPEVLLMDEPFGALDAITKQALQEELLRIHEKTRPTIIFITHDIEEAIYLSDKVFIIAGAPGAGIPGTLVQKADVDLPRPRDAIATRELPEYLRLRHVLLEGLHANRHLGDQ